MFYSPQQNTWFDPTLKQAYIDAGTWPDDAQQYPHEVYVACTNPPSGKVMEPNKKGEPTLVDIPLPLFTTLIAAALTRVDQAHAEFLLKAVGNPTQVEINTWPLKLEIKNAILAELPLNQEQQAFVDSAGLDTPAKQTAWASSVHAKSTYSAHATGVAEAVRDTAKELVKAAQTAEELEAVMQQLTALADQKLAEVLALKG